MKKNINKKNTIGYIEGYYGKLLSWDNRKLIVNSLKKNNMNTYFYAPKEDENHRLKWREQYKIQWRTRFREFSNFCNINNINIIAGIAPGLDFDFKNFNEKTPKNEPSDFILLYNKAKQLLDDGATSIALLLDDIPENFKDKFGNNVSEGTTHGVLANMLSKSLGKNIYFVPRIYADELIDDEPYYLKDLSFVLNPKIKVFYCGKNVVSKTLTNYSKIKKILNNEIIYWDNYYANDYCPRRFFIGPFIGRKKLGNIMINPTGLVNTDLIILDIVAYNLSNEPLINEWRKILKVYGVPVAFNKIKQFFLKPDFGSNSLQRSFEVNIKHIEALDFLLWKWKSELSREWYPYLFSLKHDLQLKLNILTSERLIKTQTIPLSEYVMKKLNKGEL
ncbi:beta-N-acetylglucosaminidase domain-containing protein [Alphaproteobacteria bacterium]|nr:protein O-GlcNAcase [Alphaproteobacteria bacterium]MDC1023065.1 beta-N-acetylglucosaminidase domain-containing protein [Alphaproteobacteria bacterium]